MKSLGTRLADIRRERNLTQNDIADRLDISPQAVSKWENDLTSPDIETLIKLADIYGMSLDELVGKERKEPEYLPAEKRKDINRMLMRIIVDTADGDRVRVNLPMTAIRAIVNSNASGKVFSGNKALEDIDFNQIFAMVEEGIIGELLSVDSAHGDHVTIVVE